MRDIVDELRAMAKLWEERKMPWDETTLLHTAAGEIERLQAALDGRIEVATNLQMECERLRAENKQLGDRWNDIAHERNALKAERKVEGEPYKHTLGGDGLAATIKRRSFAEVVKDLKHYLRGTDG